MSFSRIPNPSSADVGLFNVNEELMKKAKNRTGENLGVITQDSIREATVVLQKYKEGKANLDNKIIDNEEWYRLLHWKKQRVEISNGKRATGWLFSDIDNKHADFMDNFPECTVLPREKSDERAAKDLTEILPVILERNKFKDVYSKTCLYKLKNGTGIYSVLWDPSASKGMGDISVQMVDALNLYWEPGITDIQKSRNIFFVELINNSELREDYPEIGELRDLSAPTIDVARYLFNDNVDTSDKSSVVNWYYKKKSGNRTVLHYVRYVNDILLYASENDPQYSERGWYDHGKYPFVFDVLNPDAGTPFGFGLIDVGRDTQEDIDELNSIMMQTSKRSARRRYFIRDGAKINQAEFSDFDKDFVTVAGPLDENNIKEIPVSPLSGAELNIYQYKIQELKEITANKDVTTGSTGGSVTAASAIAALQESGNKTSRAMISSTYDAFREMCELVIELMRQFYDVPRTFRVLGDRGEFQYKAFGSEMLRGVPSEEFGVSFAGKDPEFDLQVKTYKSNPYSRAAQNQDAVNFYNMGFFNPQNDTPSLAALDMIEFEGKEKVIEKIQKNGHTHRLLTQFMPMMIQAVAMMDRVQGTNNAAMIAGSLGMDMSKMLPAEPAVPEKTEKAADITKTDSVGQKLREDHHVVKNAKDRAAASTAARS
ncbi:MAG: hypothetical protein IKB08_00340 [Clostridia bacterium]|nr:hypothetical protein [Clostridia bacterium]